MSNNNDKVTLFHLLSATAANNTDKKASSNTSNSDVMVKEPIENLETKTTPTLPKFTAREEVVAESPASKEEVESLATAADFLSDFNQPKTGNEPINVIEEEEEPEMRLFASNIATSKEDFLPTEEETAVNLAEDLADEVVNNEIASLPTTEVEEIIHADIEEPTTPIANIPISETSEQEEEEIAQDMEAVIFDESEEVSASS
ncbi:MAG: hypothetical protein AAFP82_21410, partial [Bacteroidota bacterium]